MIPTFLVYIVVQFFHLCSWPLQWLLFHKQKDGGHGIGKVLSMVLIAYGSWILGSLGIVAYSRATIAGTALALAVLSLFIARSNRARIGEFLRREKRLLVMMEIIFLITFAVFTLFRAYNPEISFDVNLYAAEKFPDMVFFHAILKHDTLPPPDLWFAGPENYINYYYYGYFVQATPIRLAGVDPWIGYNLALSLLFSLSFLGAFSLLINSTGSKFAGWCGAVFLTLMSNLYGLVPLLRKVPFDPIQLWNGSRVIKKELLIGGAKKVVDSTINEFPLFSFVLGDLHAHLLALPLSLLVLHLLFAFFQAGKSLFAWIGEDHKRVFNLLVFAIAFGTLITGNFWDLPTYFLLSGLIFLILGLVDQRPLLAILSWELFLGIMFLTVRYGLFLPFFQHYQPPEATLATLGADHRTMIMQFLTIHGFLFFLALSFLLVRLFDLPLSGRRRLLLLAIPTLSGMAAGFGFSNMTVALLVFVLVATCMLMCHARHRKDLFALALLLMATAVLLGCEFVFIKDFYGPPNDRMNTVFKFYYEAWIFLALAGAYAVDRTESFFAARPKLLLLKLLNRLAIAVLFTASMFYTLYAIPEKADQFKPLRGRPTLNGFAYIRERYPADYRAIEWLREQEQGDAVVAEASGAPYSYHGRVAAMTGLRSILGWGNHESLWRDWTWKIVGERTTDLRNIFKSIDPRQVAELLVKYDVRYVFVGSLENQEFYSYDRNGFEKFRSVADTIYQQDDVSIWKVREDLSPDRILPYQKSAAHIIAKDRGRIVLNEKGWKVIQDKHPVTGFGRRGTEQGMFVDPRDIAIDPDGNLYIADTGNHRIQKFSPTGTFINAWGTSGTEPGQFNTPTGLAVDGGGNVLVADTWNHRVQVFDADGKFLKTWGSDRMFWAPKDIAVDTDGFIFVVDTGFQRVHKFRSDGTEISVFGSKGSDPGQLMEPVGIVIGPDDRVYIADTANQRVAVFDRAGVVLSNWYIIGWEEFYTEPFLTFSPGGYLVAGDSRNNRLMILNQEGKVTAVWEGEIAGAKLNWPMGLAFDSEGSLWVVDSLVARVKKFSSFEADLGAQ